MKLKKIVATCPAGLGNRIKCMISTIKRCDEIIEIGQDATPYLYWPINKECGCEAEDLFKSIYPFKKIYKGELPVLEVEVYPEKVTINKSWKLQTTNIREVDFKYHKLPSKDIAKFLPYFRFIEPAQDIQDAAAAFINKHFESFVKGEVVGVHIRKGDFKDLYDGRKDISKEDDFIERMTCLLEVNPNYKFLLCTEDEGTENKFKEIFGEDTIIHFPKRFRDRNNTNGIKEAFVDMLLLSACPIIIGTFLSTFTELAWWFGRCRAQVYIPGADNKEAVAKVMAKLPQEGEGIHKKIWRKLRIWLRIWQKQKI